MWDLSVGNQLAGVFGVRPGLFLPQAYPYLTTEGDVFDLAVFQSAATFPGPSSLDWEPEVFPNYSTGTVEIASGAVTLTGGTFPDYPTNAGYSRRFYVNNQIYDVASVTDGTHLTLADSSVNATAGTAYKYAHWGYREVDPKYAFAGEMEFAHDEYANALTYISESSLANSARIGFHELLIPVYRRTQDIIDSLSAGLYEQWQDDLETMISYETAEGFTLLEWLKERNGIVWWSNYVDEGFLSSENNKNRWRTRNQRIMESCAAKGIPNAPIFRRLCGDQVTEVPDDYTLQMLEDVQAFQPYQIAFWGQPGEVDAGFISTIEQFTKSLPWGGSIAPDGTSIKAVFSPASPPLAYLGV